MNIALLIRYVVISVYGKRRLHLQDKIQVRCPKCRRILCWVGKETLGVSQIKCFHNDCLKITDFLFYSEKVYVFSKKLQKRKDILNSLPQELKEIIMYAVIE